MYVRSSSYSVLIDALNKRCYLSDWLSKRMASFYLCPQKQLFSAPKPITTAVLPKSVMLIISS